MKKLYRWIAVLVVCSVGAGVYYMVYRTKQSDVLAVIDGEKVGTQDFLYRYWEYLKITGIKDNLATRHMILRNLINERLMLHEARRLAWDQTPEYQHQAEEARIAVLLDTYSRRTIGDTVKVSEDELKRAFSRSRTKVSVRHLYARTEAEALQYKRMLDAGQSFETLAKAAFRDPRLAANGGYLGYIGPDEMEPAFEDAAFALPVGAISAPVRTEHGYSIIKVEKRVTLPLADQFDFEQQRSKLTRDVRAKKIRDRNLEYARSLVDENQVRFDDAAIHELFAEWKNLSPVTPDETRPDTMKLGENAGKRELLRFGTTVWTMQDFLNKMAFTASNQRAAVHTEKDLREFAIGLLVREVVLQKATAAGLDREAGVQAKIAERVNNFIFIKWRAGASDTVAYEETMPSGLSESAQATWKWRHGAQDQIFRKHFDQKTEIYRFPDEVRIREIYLLSNAAALAVLKESMAGKEFDKLARKYSKRSWAALKGGDMGYHEREEYGPIGEQIFGAKPGTIFGPVPLDSGFSLIQVLDKRPGREKTFDEAKSDIYEELLPSWKDYAFTHALQQLEKRSTVQYDTLKLQSIPYIDPMKLVQGE